jgi:replicative DNA helicase
MIQSNLSAVSEKLNSHLLTERAVLGVILMDPSQLARGGIHIKSELMFLDDKHRAVWRAMLDLEMSGVEINLITVDDRLRKLGSSLNVQFLVGLTEGAPVGQSLEHFTKMVVDNYTERRFREILEARLAMGGSDIAGLMDALIVLIMETDNSDEFTDLGPLARNLVAKIESGESLLVGHLPQNTFPQLDETAPLCRGDLLVIGGQTSMGKTAFAIRLTTGLMNMGARGIYLPFEGSFDSLVIRMMSQECGIGLSDIRKNKVPPETIENLKGWANAMGGEVSFNNNVGNVTSVIHKIKLRKATGNKLDYVLIDHLHLMQLEKAGIREGFIDITKKLIQIAKDEDILVIVLAQFRKLTEDEADERPRGSFIRESATIQQDAHHIWLLHDPDFKKQKTTKAAKELPEAYELPHSPFPTGLSPKPAEIIIEKNREGSVGLIEAHFNRSTGLWSESKN